MTIAVEPMVNEGTWEVELRKMDGQLLQLIEISSAHYETLY